jgi:regulator of sigma E protease
MIVLLAILGLGLLIVVHEAGHFFMARWCGMKVERFSIGFGPAILKWRSKETQFQVSPILFGGYVQITGMNPHEEYDPDDARVYPNRPTWQRFLAILAGPAMNYVCAVVIILIVFATAGIESGTSWYRVGGTEAGKPAAAADLKAGDRIIAVDGQTILLRVDGKVTSDLQDHVQKAKGERPTVLRVLRDGQELDVPVTAVWNPDAPTGEKDVKGAYVLGIALQEHAERVDVGLGGAAYHAAKYPWVLSGRILEGLYLVATRKVDGELGGPVMITQAIYTQFKEGWITGLEMLALLNVYLGLFNLLPLPALDGGRLAFLGYELATRRRPNPRVEAAVHLVGFAVLFTILILVTFRDIKRLFT